MSERTPVLDAVAVRALEGALGPRLTDNVDPERFPDGMRALTAEESVARLEHLMERAAELEWFDRQLDPESRRVLADRLVFHVLGHEHARVGPTITEVRELLRTAHEQLIVAHGVTPLSYAGGARTHLFDLRTVGFPIELESYLLGVQGAFQLQQYDCPTHPEARPAPGDIAIDAGACCGETALWLADRVGPEGRVLALEIAPENLAILHANLDRNPELASRIELAEAALWDRSGAELSIDLGGPASTVTGAAARGANVVRSTTIDDLVHNGVVDGVDFIKMDIEGAEPAALRGASTTLTRCRPRLALSAYHDIDHLWQLPRILDDSDLGYRFALGHFTAHDEETVLYAWAPDA